MKTLLKTTIKAAIEAGKAIMQVYERDFEVDVKDDNSPITEADRNANTIIQSYLEKTGIPIISEENKLAPFAIRKDWKQCWIVDPLDGTKEFVGRNGEFTVNIALIENGAPKLGVIYVPVTKTLYFSVVNERASYRYRLEEVTVKVSDILSKATRLQTRKTGAKLKVFVSRSYTDERTQGYIRQLRKEGKEVEEIMVGSSLKFCWLAEGKADLYPRFSSINEWDTAAGHAICNGVGVKVLQHNSTKELVYNKSKMLNPWFFCKI